jgi:hypothetical protein
MAITNPAPRHMIFATAADTFTASPNVRVKRMIAVANGTNGAFDVLDAASGNRIAYTDTGAVTDISTTILEDAKVKGIYINAIPTDGRVHVYYE